MYLTSFLIYFIVGCFFFMWAVKRSPKHFADTKGTFTIFFIVLSWGIGAIIGVSLGIRKYFRRG